MKIYGIDLGTCMSSIAHIDEHQQPVVLLNNEAEPLTNSAVWFESPGNTIVGKLAYDNAGGFADQVVLHVKSKMGQMDPEHNPVKVTAAGNTYTPEEISARILKELARYGEISSTLLERILQISPIFCVRHIWLERIAGQSPWPRGAFDGASQCS